MPLCLTRSRWKSGTHNFPAWAPISIAPSDRNLELAVIDGGGVHVFTSPCCRILDGWCDAETKQGIGVEPTHWREWEKARYTASIAD